MMSSMSEIIKDQDIHSVESILTRYVNKFS